MWSPTKATPTSSSSLSSDNKNIREEVDDCRCSNIETIVDVDLTITPQQQQQQQQIIKLNNKQQTFGSVGAQSSYVGQQAGGQQERKFVKSEEDEQEEESDCKHFTESATDSGFISGPQQIDISSSANILNDHSTKIKRNSAGAVEQYNITTTALSRKAQKQQKEQEQKEEEDENLIFDSGCIAEVEDSAEIEPKSVTTSNASTTTTESASNDSQMLIKHNVDAGMAEWFCNLSLQTDGTQTADNTSRLGINNLNALQRQRTTAQQQQQQQQQNLTTGNSIITPTVPTITMTPSSAWEQFYQQNDDGDTPLHLACISGSVDVPTIRNRNGNTALHLACISGEEQCVRALIIPISPSEINEARNQYGNRANDKTYLSCARLPSDLEIRNYDVIELLGGQYMHRFEINKLFKGLMKGLLRINGKFICIDCVVEKILSLLIKQLAIIDECTRHGEMS
uniref:ANK_REP_REGION domain-containing protein n=1 Tax=Glossina pallidipes TaxID=7398 RepID=A0A1A9Z623_GLOPL